MDNINDFLSNDMDEPSAQEIQDFVVRQAEALLGATQDLIKSQVKSGYFEVLAKANRAYYNALFESGFSREEAVRIVASVAGHAANQGK